MFICIHRVYWAYHAHFPAEANRIFESCDTQQQKLLTNERNGGGDQSVSRNTTISPKYVATVHYLAMLLPDPFRLKIIRKPNAQPGIVYCIMENFHGRKFRELQAICENIIRECLFVDKDRAIVLIRENSIREMLYLKKFSPAKISRHIVTHSLTTASTFYVYIINLHTHVILYL